MNVLILSVGTRNKIVQYFVNELQNDGNVIVTDMSNLAPAIYEANKYYIVPQITDSNYIDSIIKICQAEKIDCVLSLIDPELSLLAKNKSSFSKIGVQIIGSSFELCELSLDKYEMYKWLKSHNYLCARTYIGFDDFYHDYCNGSISFPVFVKPRKGSASLCVSKVDNLDLLKVLLNSDDELIIQEFLDGDEIGADVYIDLISGEVISIFTKKKIKMRAGETDKSVSFKDDELFEYIADFVTQMGYRGQIDIDIFKINGKHYISEVNPRFGGGYPHAYEAGCNHINYIINNMKNIINKPTIGQYPEGVYMMKYNEIKIINEEL